MTFSRVDVAQVILGDCEYCPVDTFEAWSPVNIALCKYWGKRNGVLNLPVNDSLSVALPGKGTHTRVTRLQVGAKDIVFLNDRPVHEADSFYKKVVAHLDLFRLGRSDRFRVDTVNTIATAAGLASSASGFSALTRAVAGVQGFSLDDGALSILARLGSGSACRSIFEGFVRWHKGEAVDGMDSCAAPLSQVWPGLRLGVLTLTGSAKKVGSREGMARTVESTPLYSAWPVQAEADIAILEEAIAARDFEQLGATAEHNALTMHATMIASWPPLLYWEPESVAVMQKVWQMREDGVPVYLTMDAGPNVKLLFEAQVEGSIRQAFPDVEVVKLFP
ncbi:diphosphomevalonate decarboxylase [Kistimonas asteriae]|uniref:diphosphomevalonate decarboxylase n=1 Tax=Kistimonas asteriae TaxID=517724 RepID=UPI001FEAB337|nr:diphosphomevalonate decarboxylase [Kistimonas asteriae]